MTKADIPGHTRFNRLPPPGGSVDWLRETLAGEGVKLHPECALHRGLQAATTECSASGTRRYASIDDAVEERLEIFGADYLTKAIHQADSEGWTAWRKRARHLVKGDPNPFFPAKHDRYRDLSWELIIACICSTFCERVEFREPDVIAHHDGQRIGIAAKCIYSENFDRLQDSVVKGAKQGEKAALAGAIDKTVVFVNATSIWPHAKLARDIRRARVFQPTEVEELIGGYTGAFFGDRDDARWAQDLGGRTSLETVLACIPTLVAAQDDWLVPFFYSTLLGERRNSQSRFAVEFHRAATRVLKWSG